MVSCCSCVLALSAVHESTPFAGPGSLSPPSKSLERRYPIPRNPTPEEESILEISSIGESLRIDPVEIVSLLTDFLYAIWSGFPETSNLWGTRWCCTNDRSLICFMTILRRLIPTRVVTWMVVKHIVYVFNANTHGSAREWLVSPRQYNVRESGEEAAVLSFGTFQPDVTLKEGQSDIVAARVDDRNQPTDIRTYVRYSQPRAVLGIRTTLRHFVNLLKTFIWCYPFAAPIDVIYPPGTEFEASTFVTDTGRRSVMTIRFNEPQESMRTITFEDVEFGVRKLIKRMSVDEQDAFSASIEFQREGERRSTVNIVTFVVKEIDGDEKSKEIAANEEGSALKGVIMNR